MSPDFHRIQLLIAADPKAALGQLITFVARKPPPLESAALLEELVDVADEALVSAIETEAETNDPFAHVVADAYVGDIWGPAADRFRALQHSVRDRLPDVFHWEGWLPIGTRRRSDTDKPSLMTPLLVIVASLRGRLDQSRLGDIEEYVKQAQWELAIDGIREEVERGALALSSDEQSDLDSLARNAEVDQELLRFLAGRRPRSRDSAER